MIDILLVKRFIIWLCMKVVRLRGEMVLIFLGVVCCLLVTFIFGMRVWYFFTGQVVAGEIVGYASGAKGLYNIMASNYRIRIVYENEIFMVTSIESVIHSSGTIPNRDLWKECAVYFTSKISKTCVYKRLSYFRMDGVVYIYTWLFGNLVLGLGMTIVNFTIIWFKTTGNERHDDAGRPYVDGSKWI